MARLLRDQRERDEPHVALRQHAAGAHHVAAAAVPSAPALAGAEMPAPAAAGGPLAFEGRLTLMSAVMSESEHVGFPLLLKIYL